MKDLGHIFLVLLFPLAIFGQDSYSPDTEDLTQQLKQLRLATLKANSNQEISKHNQTFYTAVKAAVSNKKKFDSDSIPSFGYLPSPDKKFSLYTWNTFHNDVGYKYYCLIQFKNGQLLDLKDKSDMLLTPELKVCSPKQWFGALYYQIIPTKVSKKEQYYVLLGWDGHSGNSLKKVIDILHYNKRLGVWEFGRKVFGPPFRSQTRFFMEYSGEVTASMKYHEKSKRIVFDHLTPLNPGLEGVYEFYVPDLSFDAFEFRKDGWYFIQNVDVRGDQSMDNYVTPKTNLRLE